MRKQGIIAAAIGLVCLGAGAGAGWYFGPGPDRRYCKDCAEIIALQAKGESKTAIDMMDIERLKDAMADRESGSAAFREMSGDPPDLHPECECACHRFWVSPVIRH